MIRFYASFLLLASFHFNTAYGQNAMIQEMIGHISTDSLLDRVEAITGEREVTVNGNTDTIYSRHRTRPGNVICYNYLQQELGAYGLATDSLLFGMLGKNVLAIQPGTVYPDRFYIICAHYDGMPGTTIAPAADDDASGVAVVLEAARILSRYQFEYTIVYALWDEEEQGLTGSNAYATQLASASDSLMGVINMDAIAWDGNDDAVARVHARPVGSSERIADTVFAVNSDYAIGISLLLNNPGETYSDHASFWNKGYGAVLVIEDWDNDANPHYHSTSDSMAYFNIPYYGKMAKLCIASLAALAVPVGYTAVENMEVPVAIQVYPNPAQTSVTVAFGKKCNAIVVISDLSGHELMRTSSEDTDCVSMEISGFRPGYYIVTVRHENDSFSSGFFKD